jgi:hypothetical protein
MEEMPTKKGWLCRNRKLIAVIILLIIVPQLIVYAIDLANQIYRQEHPELDPFYEPEYSLTVWIAPEEETFTLHLDFYGSEQDAYAMTDWYSRDGIVVEPQDNEKNDLCLYTLPENTMSVWVKVYFDDATEEPNVILRVDMRAKAIVHLLGREISILIEPLS